MYMLITSSVVLIVGLPLAVVIRFLLAASRPVLMVRMFRLTLLSGILDSGKSLLTLSRSVVGDAFGFVLKNGVLRLHVRFTIAPGGLLRISVNENVYYVRPTEPGLLPFLESDRLVLLIRRNHLPWGELHVQASHDCVRCEVRQRMSKHVASVAIPHKIAA